MHYQVYTATLSLMPVSIRNLLANLSIYNSWLAERHFPKVSNFAAEHLIIFPFPVEAKTSPDIIIIGFRRLGDLPKGYNRKIPTVLQSSRERKIPLLLKQSWATCRSGFAAGTIARPEWAGVSAGPAGACIIKLIKAVIYSFCNKLECLSLASLSSLVYCLGANTLAYYGNRKLWP
jgi:hypothetical protein